MEMNEDMMRFLFSLQTRLYTLLNYIIAKFFADLAILRQVFLIAQSDDTR